MREITRQFGFNGFEYKKTIYDNCGLTLLTPTSDQDNFSLQYLHNINQISDETKEKYQFRIISWSNTKFSELTLKNCMVDSKENYKFDLRVKGLRNEYESDLCSNEHYLNRQ